MGRLAILGGNPALTIKRVSTLAIIVSGISLTTQPFEKLNN